MKAYFKVERVFKEGQKVGLQLSRNGCLGSCILWFRPPLLPDLAEELYLSASKEEMDRLRGLDGPKA